MRRKIISAVASGSAYLVLAAVALAVTAFPLRAQSWTITHSNGTVAAGDTAVTSGTGWYVIQAGTCSDGVYEFNYSVPQSVHWNCWDTGVPVLGWAQAGPSGDTVLGLSDIMRYDPSLTLHASSFYFCDGAFRIGDWVLNADGC